MDLETGLRTLLVVSVVAAITPVRRRRAAPDQGAAGRRADRRRHRDRPRGARAGRTRADIELLANIGLGFLFLMAGYELELELFRERGGRRAVSAGS